MKPLDQQLMWARPNERPFLRRVEENALTVAEKHAWHLTDFLTPREAYLLNGVSEHKGLEVAFDGGYPGAERVRALMMPDNWYPERSDFAIVTLTLEAAPGVRATEMMHRDVLGALLGLGIERRVIGDVAEHDAKWYVFVTEAIAQFIQSNLTQVGRFPVIVSRTRNEVVLPPPAYEESTITVASLRVDAVIAQACHKSRSQSQELIARGNVQCNFLALTDADETLVAGDVLSIRGFGRVRVLEDMGSTKKDRIRLRVGVLKSNRR